MVITISFDHTTFAKVKSDNTMCSFQIDFPKVAFDNTMTSEQIDTFLYHLGKYIKCTSVFYHNVVTKCVLNGLITPENANSIDFFTATSPEVILGSIDKKDYRKFLQVLNSEDERWFSNHWFQVLGNYDSKNEWTLARYMFDGLKPDKIECDNHYKHVLSIFHQYKLLTAAEEIALTAKRPSYMRLFLNVRVKGGNSLHLANKLLKDYYVANGLKLEHE